jgi:peptidoglycan/LPS O-acetylase OafA/YrhL
LRGWASVIVCLHHISAALYGWPNFKKFFPQIFGGKFFFIFFDGSFAVYIFFVLSGLVLSLNYMKNEDARSLTGIVIRRIPRLGIPVLFSTIIIFIFMKNGFMHNSEASLLGDEVNSWFIGYYNFTPTFKDMVKSIYGVFLNGEAKYNSVLWTMRWEFFGSYYIVLFIIFLQLSNVHRRSFLWLISTLILLYIAPIIASFNFGLLLSYIYVNNKKIISILKKNKYIQILIIIIIGIVYWLNFTFEYSRISTIIMSFNSFLIVASLTFVNIFQWFFSTKISRFLGKISFPLYVVHLPTICSFSAYLIVKFPDGNKRIIIFLLSLVFSLIVACCFYPIEKLSIWFSKKSYDFITEKEENI